MPAATARKVWSRLLSGLTREDWGHAAPLVLDEVRASMLAALKDCPGSEAERVRWRIHGAQSAQDLWLLRGLIFQLVAEWHCQHEAQRRVNALLPAFRGWLPPHLMQRA